MTPEERQQVLDQLAASETRLLQLTDGLTPAQWNFHESPNRWSIAENIEHVILFENFIKGVIEKVMQAPAEPEKKQHSAAKDPLIESLPQTRQVKFNAREIVRPAGNWPDPTQLLVELRKTRVQTQVFIAEVQPGLRDHFFAHIAFGDLDCYQWLLMLGQHASRHAIQIEEIQSHPAYPA
jgi:DinB family protein